MSKINIDNELCNYIDANDGQVTLGGLAEHFAEYGYQYAQDHPAWRSVEDELPETIDWYLCYNDLEDGCEVLHFEGDGNVWMDNDWHYKSKEITHWMPLPQPPVKKGGNDEND